MSCSGQKDGLVLNHPPFVIAVVGDDGAVPKERNATGEGDASLLHLAQDAPPDILCLLRENVAEHIPQCLPLKEGCAVGAESLIDLRKGLSEGRGAEVVGQLEQHGGVGSDGEGVVVDDGHDKPLSAPFSRETLLYLLLRLVE